ncbi:hypothetical protein MCOR27_004226 [Pyricularia oryzae]|uniref:Mediator of RNA polymerase II transcription subunit 19 n=2 Tax=Pyricularia TaxID=48558 RepID=A0ABQ8P2V6_PYRGI|nr:hypothetical protein, variant [Pyricularia oryzae 70-15]KAH8846693.1 hypothetical protein MCOR01_000148 [Pyricularia oryzae]KAI6304730.1 hypothetical protein MCOR33_000248 [Pyricularia grisea]EHA51535.1 hypothetical protein, variant [Pyricularia oryzae 70-15]KAH9428144.1 hypothetical protein MCOR02_011632 [Pyricularia oryzae]KAI6263496.1 hypothetical protein MCOR19_000394 [Pyricularia oryzae]
MSFHPQTPQSPSQTSPSISDPSTSLNSSMTSTTTNLPTPAHSVTGSCLPSEMNPDIIMGDDTPQKRKRALEDGGDRDHKKAHIEDRRLGIENLHMDVGEKYLLCRTQHVSSFPRMSDDLFEAFGLTGIAAEVARVLPNGEKNAMRKTYKGHIKKLGVAGHFDAVKKNHEDPSSLLAMYFAPAEDWINTEVHGKDITAGLSNEALQNLSRATTMARGPISKKDWDTSVLGDLDKAAKQTSSAKVTAPNTPLNLPPLNRPKGSQPPAGEAARIRRVGKKRSYGDSSFEGYSEAFTDDDPGADVGYSTGEGDGGQKRRKKNPGTPAQNYPSAVRQQNYGPGMVGA